MSRVLGVVILLVQVAVGSHAVPQDPGVDLARVKDAIAHRIRFEMYWWGREDLYRQGEVLSLQVAHRGPLFVARIDDYEVRGDDSRIAAFFKGRQGDTRTWITQSSRTPVESLSHPGEVEWWTRLDRRLRGAGIIHDVIKIPYVEVPHFKNDDRTKSGVRRAIVAAMQGQLSWNLLHRQMRIPSLVTLIVADFNVEDPAAFVLVAELDAVYEVSLYDPADKNDPRFREGGELLALPFEGRPEDEAEIASKIRALGARHRVKLLPNEPNNGPGKPNKDTQD
jgi:hypothetical protein